MYLYMDIKFLEFLHLRACEGFKTITECQCDDYHCGDILVIQPDRLAYHEKDWKKPLDPTE